MSIQMKEEKQQKAQQWFEQLRNEICASFEQLEETLAPEGDARHKDLPAGRFERKEWTRPGGGAGIMSVMRGRVFEKVGVNISTVKGKFSESFRKEIPGTEDSPEFWASGISLVAHLRSPKVPAVHMNTRMIMTQKSWFGGGFDLTPMLENEADKTVFHQAAKECCDRHDSTYYEKFSQWCDRYFYLPHRKEPRGVGGIFYDRLDTGDWEKDFSFTQDVGQTFKEVYTSLVQAHMNEGWSDEEREIQLVKRGRYAEFNLLYDRGTRFGLETQGNTEAILMSLPPEAKWP